MSEHTDSTQENETRPPSIRAPLEEHHQEEQEHSTQGLQVPNEESWQIPPEWGVRALILLNYTTTFISYVGSFIWKLGRGIVKSFQPETYVFFTDSDVPYNRNELNLDAPGVAQIAWYYDASKHIFISTRLFNTSEHIHVHHLPYLSAEIKYNDLVLQDLTDFIERVRWAGDLDQGPPSASVLLGAWSLQTGIILQKSESLRLIVINEEGNEQTISLRA